jgi:hypothetical protein
LAALEEGGTDRDHDGVGDASDNCADTPNPDQADADGDGLGDVCDPCPNTGNDRDGDCVDDYTDNCYGVPNPDQADADGDGEGDACEYNILFVTRDEWLGAELGGLAGADAICQAAADQAAAVGSRVHGNYKAWLSDGSTDARDRLVHSPYPYTNLGADPLAYDWEHLTSPPLLGPPFMDEYGTAHPYDVRVWTGTTAQGTSTGYTCGRWDDPDAQGTRGLSWERTPEWTDSYHFDCSSYGHLYCIQQQ